MSASSIEIRGLPKNIVGLLRLEFFSEKISLEMFAHHLSKTSGLEIKIGANETQELTSTQEGLIIDKAH